MKKFYNNQSSANVKRLLNALKIEGGGINDEISLSHMRDFMAQLFGTQFADSAFPPLPNQCPINDPFESLFIWSVMIGKADMAEYFWSFCRSPLCLAIIACRIFRLTSDLMAKEYDKSASEQCSADADRFEQLAVDLANESYKMNNVSFSAATMFL